MKIQVIKILLYIIFSVGAFKYGEYLGGKNVQVKEVVKVQERVRTRTKVIEHPDGTKITTIDEKKDTDSVSLKETKPSLNIWSVGISYAPPLGQREVYTLSVDRRILGDIWLGVYGRTDREFGVRARYDL
jgi:hypothetical protein